MIDLSTTGRLLQVCPSAFPVFAIQSCPTSRGRPELQPSPPPPPVPRPRIHARTLLDKSGDISGGTLRVLPSTTPPTPSSRKKMAARPTVSVYTDAGEASGSVALPKVFTAPIRMDVVQQVHSEYLWELKGERGEDVERRSAERRRRDGNEAGTGRDRTNGRDGGQLERRLGTIEQTLTLCPARRVHGQEPTTGLRCRRKRRSPNLGRILGYRSSRRPYPPCRRWWYRSIRPGRVR